MGSLHRLICDRDNLIHDAALIATAQLASTDLRLLARRRQGGGDLRLLGPYTGARDVVIEAKTMTASSGALSATRPVFTGAGTGTLEVGAIAADATACTIDLTLVDAGAQPEPATLEFYGVTLQARAPGSSGNGIALTVNRSAISLTPSQYSTLTTIRAGQHEFEGAEWDWGSAAQLRPDEVPPDAPRYVFDGYPQVHRHWREWRESRWVFRLDPAPEYEIPAGTKVLAVTGHYTLAVTHGSVSETYTGITLYDFLSAIRAQSALLDVVGTVAADRTPGGMAVTDLPLRTDAHVLPARSSRAGGYLLDARCRPDAPTELITISHLGEDKWSVRGAVSGPLPEAVTARPYSAGPIGFTIPSVAGNKPPVERISLKYTPAARQDEEPSPPPVCLLNATPGANMTPKTITFTYRRRPEDTDCDCETMLAPRLRLGCLGLEGETAMSDLPAPYANRLKAVYDWWKNMTALNADLVDNESSTGGGSQQPYLDLLLAPANTGITLTVRFNLSVSTPSEYDDLKNEIHFSPIKRVSGSTLYRGSITLEWGYGSTILGSLTGVVIDRSRLSSSVPTHITNVSVGLTLFWRNSPPAEGGGGSEDEQFSIAANANDLELARDVMGIYLAALDEVRDSPAALAMWDTAWAAAQDDLAGLIGLNKRIETLNEKKSYLAQHEAACDRIRIEAGIVPKSNASSGSGGRCWQDDPAATHWWEDDEGYYAPIFSNTPYHSCCGKIRPTMEFGFVIAVKCESRLKEGDKITIQLRGAGASTGGYMPGDSYTLPVIAAQAATLAGGTDGSGAQTWAVRINGETRPPYMVDPTAPQPYTAAPIELTIRPGALPYALGDRYSLALEAARLMWRREGQPWQQAPLRDGEEIDLGDGLRLRPVFGLAPSFIPGDQWHWRVQATHGLDHLRTPRPGRAYGFGSSACQIDADLGTTRPLTGCAVALHDLPAGATVTLSGGVAAADEWTEPLTASEHGGVLIALFAQRTARYLRLTVSGAPGGAHIGWWWAGLPWQPSLSADVAIRREYGLIRPSGYTPGALYYGCGTGGMIRWNGDDCWLTHDDLATLLPLLDHLARSGGEPIIFIPDVRRPTGALLATIDTDAVTITDWLRHQCAERGIYAVDLPLRAVIQ